MKKLFPLIFILCLFLTTQSTSQFSYGDYEEPSVPSMFYIYKGEPIEFPLQSYNADVDIVGNIANVKLTQTFINVSGQTIDAKYRFPGSTQAAVNGMTMKIKDRVIYAQIQEKQQARETFETAKKEGKRASLLSQEKPNIFTTEVANIYSGDTIQVIVEYSEIIEYKDYTYSFVLPTKIGGRYQGYNEKTGTKDGYDVYQNPYYNKTIDFNINVSISSIFDVAKVKCKTHTIFAEQEGNKTFVKMNTPSALDRDFILQYEMVSKKVESGLLIHEGEEENFFLLMLQAPKRVPAEEILPREYVFVVDVSGSMSGKPIETAIHLFGNLLEKTNEKDMFNVIKFAGDNKVLFSKAEPATMENLQKGFDFLGDESGYGGTELLEALKKAMTLPKLEKYSRSVILITDGFISADLEVIEYLSQNLDKGNIFPFGIGESVNRYVIEGLANVSMSEPFIITDMEDADKEADKFKEYIDSPVMTDIKIDFEGLDVYDIIPEKIPDVYAQRPIIISGKFRGAPEGIVYVNGQNGKQEMKTYFEVERFAQEDTSQVLKYLWARRKLQTLQDFPGEYSFRKKDNNKAAIIDLGLKYHLMTNHTSFVAVDTEAEPQQTNVERLNSREDVDYSLSPLTLLNTFEPEEANWPYAKDFRFLRGDVNYSDTISYLYKENSWYKLFPVKDGTLDKSYNEGDFYELKIDDVVSRSDILIFNDKSKIENIYIKYFGIHSFLESEFNFSIITNEKNEIAIIRLNTRDFCEIKNYSSFIEEFVEAILESVEETMSNSIYESSIIVKPSGEFDINGINYATLSYGYVWREEIESNIPDYTKYSMIFEVWDENKKLISKGILENIYNSTNPFISSVYGKVIVPEGEFCMHYCSLHDPIQLGSFKLNSYKNYYIRLKGVVNK